MANEIKSERMMDILLRALKGEALSIKRLSDEYCVSTRSISRDISALNIYFYEHRDTAGTIELIYDAKSKSYLLDMDNYLTGKEMLCLLKILIASRALTNEELVGIIGKLKQHATPSDRKRIEYITSKEIYNYIEVKHDSNGLIDTVWELTDYIETCHYITIEYIKMNRTQVVRKLMPVSITFSEYYFYLIAYECLDDNNLSVPKYFRVDRITNIVRHRDTFKLTPDQDFDESLLRKRSQFMWPGSLRRIRFEFSGPSVQAILDRLPTARILEKNGSVYLIEAQIYGDGIKMFLLSQGKYVKVISPQEFKDEMRDEIAKMLENY